MLLPAQSYLASCSQAIAYCTSESSLGKFRSLDNQFNSGQFAGDPWTHVDTFGRSSFQKSLMTTFKGLKPTPVKAVTIPSRSSSISSTVGRNVLPGSGGAQELTLFGNISSTEVSKTVEDLKEGCSKD